MARLTLLVMTLLALPALAAEPEGRTVIIDVAKGGALGGLATAATVYLYSMRKNRTRITPDPLNVRGVSPSVKEPVCEAKHRALDQRLADNRDDHANIFPRLSSLESRVGVLEGTISEIKSEYKSIDDKLTVLLRRK